jgi:Protein of unknown function (DUF3618)
MGEGPGAAGAPVGEPAQSVEQLEEQIAQTRVELGDTVAALAEKTDVKARLRQRASTATAQGRLMIRNSGDRVAAQVRRNPVAVAMGGASLAGLVVWRVVRR